MSGVACIGLFGEARRRSWVSGVACIGLFGEAWRRSRVSGVACIGLFGEAWRRSRVSGVADGAVCRSPRGGSRFPAVLGSGGGRRTRFARGARFARTCGDPFPPDPARFGCTVSVRHSGHPRPPACPSTGPIWVVVGPCDLLPAPRLGLYGLWWGRVTSYPPPIWTDHWPDHWPDHWIDMGVDANFLDTGSMVGL